MMSPVEATFVNEITKDAIKALKKSLTPLLKDLYSEINEFFEVSTKKYFETQGLKNLYLKTLLHRTQPVNFFDIYQPVSLEFKNIVFEPRRIDDLFDRSSFIAVIGEAGSGKSMFAKYMFLTAVKEANRIPLIIELRYLDMYDKTLYEYIVENIYDKKITKNQKILDRLLKSGKLLIILDGYDEIGGANSAKIIASINKFVDEYPYNYYLLSSRPYVNAESVPGFSNYSICPLTEEQIESFVRKQKLDKELAENAIKSIKDERNVVIASFMQNPLLLALYLLTYKGNSNIPTKKSIFYRRVIDTLFKEHDSVTKFGFERVLKSKLDQEQIETLLKIISFFSYSEGKSSFTKDYLLDQLANIKKMNIPFDFSTEAVLDDLKTGVSIWMEDGDNYYFTHRSLQEYFAVMFINNIKTQKKLFYDNIQKNICSKGAINETRNFLSLLKEVEEYEYNKYLLLPNLEIIQSRINEDNTAWAPINIFLSKMTIYQGPNVIRFILCRASRTYAFIFDIVEFEFIKAFEAFLLSPEVQKLYKNKFEASQATTLPSLRQFEFDIHADEIISLLTLFSTTEPGMKSILSFKETLEKEIAAAKDYVDTCSNNETLALNILLGENYKR
jgi:hypothetical protein